MTHDLKKRLVIACVGFVLLLSLLSARLLEIELVKGEQLSAQARAHYEYKETLPARRGRIFDRSGELLARSQTVFSLVVDCYHLRDQGLAAIGLAAREKVSAVSIKKRYLPDEILSSYREFVVDCLAETIGMPRQELARRLRSKENGEIVLLRGIEDDFARQIETILDENNLGGLYLRAGERRYYPSPLSLTQVIGFVSEEGAGQSGIEQSCNQIMSGTPGFRYCERDRQRREILAYRGLQVDPVAGQDVHLTINMALQAVLEEALDGVIDRYRPEKISAVWLDPRTGEVLAMASRPHFDLGTREGLRGAPPVRRNPAISDLYEPGSTFKIVGYGGAFDRGLANPSTEVDCHLGKFEFDGMTIKDHHPYGKLTAKMAFAKSSNIGAFLIARPLNRDNFHHYVEQFGFGRRTDIELSAESSGRVYPVKSWSRSSFSSQVIGYEVAATPLQVAVAGSVIARDGIYLPPTIIKGIQGSERGAVLLPGRERSERRVIDTRAAGAVTQCMIESMSAHGTGTNGNVLGYTVAGKTGTARKHVAGEGYVEGRYVASFMGFLPADNPQLLGLIVIDDPQADGEEVYGGAVAAPVFKTVAEAAVKILEIAPDQPEELAPVTQQKLAELSVAPTNP